MDVSPNGGGTLEVEQLVPSSYPARYDFRSGEKARLEAVPAPGYRFVNWSGDLSGATNPTTIVMDCDKKVTASFSRMTTLTMAASGRGSTTPAAGIHQYGKGTVVGITATPGIGWQFDSWVGDVISPDSATTILTMDSDKNVTAKFSLDWSLVGISIGSVVLIGLLVTVLIIRRRADYQ